MIAPAKTLLIDFDGVVFKNVEVAEAIKRKSIRYVAERKNQNLRTAKVTNRRGYQTLGHTCRIVSDEHVLDYNRYVFDADMDEVIKQSVNDHDVRLVEDIFNIKQRRELDLVLCTNAPNMYCQSVLSSLGMPIDTFFDTRFRFTSDTGLVKPLRAYYTHVENTLDAVDAPYQFIDDSIVNIVPIAHDPRWNACVINNTPDLLHYLNTMS
jgi:FMN phosphatase YigB (HAD superfamily)